MQVINTLKVWLRWPMQWPSFDLLYDALSELKVKPRTELNFDGTVYSIRRDADMNTSFTNSPPVSAATDIDFVCKSLMRNEQVIASLNVDQCFVRQTNVPRIARPKLEALLRFETTRLTPFNQNEIFNFWEVDEINTQSASINVQHIIAKKSVVSDLVAAIAKQGAVPLGIIVRKQSGAIFPYPLSMDGTLFRNAAAQKYKKVVLCTTTFAFLSISSAVVMMNWKQSANMDFIRDETTVLLADVKHIQNSLDRVKSGNAAVSTLYGQRDTKRTEIEIIEELSRLLPDDAYLDGISILENQVSLDGQAQSPEQLIQLFEESDSFQSVNLTSSVFKLPGESLSRFSIQLLATPLPVGSLE